MAAKEQINEQLIKDDLYMAVNGEWLQPMPLAGGGKPRRRAGGRQPPAVPNGGKNLQPLALAGSFSSHTHWREAPADLTVQRLFSSCACHKREEKEIVGVYEKMI